MKQPPYAPFIAGTIKCPWWQREIIDALIKIDWRHKFNHAWLYRGAWRKPSAHDIASIGIEVKP